MKRSTETAQLSNKQLNKLAMIGRYIDKSEKYMNKANSEYNELILSLGLDFSSIKKSNQRLSKFIIVNPFVIVDKDSSDKASAIMNITKHIQSDWAHLFPQFQSVSEQELYQGLLNYNNGVNSNSCYDNTEQLLSLIQHGNYRVLLTSTFLETDKSKEMLNRMHIESLKLNILCTVKLSDVIR